MQGPAQPPGSAYTLTLKCLIFSRPPRTRMDSMIAPRFPFPTVDDAFLCYPSDDLMYPRLDRVLGGRRVIDETKNFYW